MKYYPVYLNIKGRHVLVVGAGEVAWQKITVLLECGARVRVVAPEAVAKIQELSRTHALEWVRRSYTSEDLEQIDLIIAATDDPALQKQIAEEARARRIWVNVVDVTPLCDFISPAFLSQGDVQIAISTGGASPALAKFIREKLEPLFGPEYGVLADVLQHHRSEILKLPLQRRQALWEAIINEEFIDRVKREGKEAVEARLKEFVHGKSVV